MIFSRVILAFLFQRGSGLELIADADADYASTGTDGGSVSGGAVMCAGACMC